MAQSPFKTSPVYSGIVQGYKNPQYIADMVMPVVPVNSQEFIWDYRSIKNLLVAPDNEVGRTSMTPRLQFNAEQRSSFTKDYGYDIEVPKKDQDRAADQRSAGNTGVNPLDYAAMGAAEVLRLRREIRCAQSVAAPANHSFVDLLSGTSQWSNVASNPKEYIQQVKESMLQEANVMVISNVGLRYLRNHPKIVEAVIRTGAREGQASVPELADLLELDAIYVGKSRQVLAAVNDIEADASTARRVWGNYCALLHLNPLNRSTTGSPFISWGFTAKYGGDIAMTMFDPDMGIKGGDRMRVAEQCREVVSAPIAGALIQNIFPAELDIGIGDTLASTSASAVKFEGL